MSTPSRDPGPRAEEQRTEDRQGRYRPSSPLAPGVVAGSLRGLGTPTRPGAPLMGRAARPWLRWLPYALALAAVGTLLPVTVTVLIHDYGMNGALAGALATAQTAPLVSAVTRPLQSWWIIGAADVLGAVAALLTGLHDGLSWPWTPMGVVGYLLLMVALGLREPPRTLVAVWLLTGAAGLAFEPVSRGRGSGVAVLLFVLTGVVLVVTASLREGGEARRKLVEQESISEAERSRRTLLEERARIARELHDVVAHHMSVITVQAESAPYRITGLPDAAREEFTAIAGSARESLTEMRRLLSVLRSEGAEGERAPQPGLDRVQQLVEATVRAGVPAELSLPADPGAVPQAVDVSAYRIVQEALANVVRHAPGAPTRVSVTVSASGRWLTVLVVNGPADRVASPLESTGTGHGLVGMRERVRLTGGTLDTGPLPDGGFRVAARMPLRDEAAPPSVAEPGAAGEAAAPEEPEGTE
ncbi:two-component sensor histidine kinase [Streptomyces solincola]|uniref:histidine kinase n=1 Tax=Streptomyces solincola TaxID=2100817 RepID=A0A2S9Q1V6_9ACTN|nr:two-component sensor histidine kinase [Streptomyces solincola]